MQKTGIAGIFAASLELTKRVYYLFHKKMFDKLLSKKCKMKNKKKNNIIDFPSYIQKLKAS